LLLLLYFLLLFGCVDMAGALLIDAAYLHHCAKDFCDNLPTSVGSKRALFGSHTIDLVKLHRLIEQLTNTTIEGIGDNVDMAQAIDLLIGLDCIVEKYFFATDMLETRDVRALAMRSNYIVKSYSV
jgi:hypothetical protein